MAWTYSKNPSTSRKDEVRFLIGDTDPDDSQLEDAQIEFALSRYPRVELAAAHCCDAIVAKYSRNKDVSLGGGSIAASQLVDHYRQLAKDLRRKARTLCAPIFGGQSKSEKERLSLDSDTPQPFFRVDHERDE